MALTFGAVPSGQFTLAPFAAEPEFEELLRWKSDDYRIVEVAEWVEDGSPADRYFHRLGITGG